MDNNTIFIEKQSVSTLINRSIYPTIRNPVRLEDIWLDYNLITQFPNFVNFEDGSVDIHNVVKIYKNRELINGDKPNTFILRNNNHIVNLVEQIITSS